MAECIKCYEEYADARKALGYKTCLECGGHAAAVISLARQESCAPLFNKGAYQLITAGTDLKDLGR